jgi:hypothetical protein
VLLTNNTFVGHVGAVLLLPPSDEASTRPVSVVAEGNLFPDFLLLGERWAGMPSEKITRTQVKWQGRNNLYVRNRSAYLAFSQEKREVKNLKDWIQFWGRAESGSIEVHREDINIQYYGLFWLDTAAALQAVRQASEPMLRELGPAAHGVGPEWDLVGPGEAYVRSLEKMSGKPLPKEELRPEAVAGGPYVLLRRQQTPRGYLSLQAAINAWQSDDMIEIRTDVPFAGAHVPKDASREGRMTIRAAPGSRPVVTQGISLGLPKVEVEIEGLAFEDAALSGEYARLTMRNCSMWNTKVGWNMGTIVYAPGQAACFFNCAFNIQAGSRIGSDQTVLLENCIVSRTNFPPKRDNEDGEVVIRRSVCWSLNPTSGSVAQDSPQKTQPRARAEESLFVGGSALTRGTGAHWIGRRNVYSLLGTYADDLGIFTLEARQKHFDSDQDSLSTVPVILDPRQWRLLPGLPKRPDGKDYGADVDKVATTPVS